MSGLIRRRLLKEGKGRIAKHLKDPEKPQDNSEVVRLAFEMNKNLDLDEYKPYLADFRDFSSNLFEIENIFSERKKQLVSALLREDDETNVMLGKSRAQPSNMFDPHPVPGQNTSHSVPLRRLQTKITSKVDGHRKSISIDNKKIHQRQIDLFNKIGQMGWKFIQEQLLVIRNTNLEERIKFLFRMSEIERYLKKYIKDKDEFDIKIHTIKKDPNLYQKLMLNYEEFLYDFLKEYKKKRRANKKFKAVTKTSVPSKRSPYGQISKTPGASPLPNEELTPDEIKSGKKSSRQVINQFSDQGGQQIVSVNLARQVNNSISSPSRV